jgi:hypothetical protein
MSYRITMEELSVLQERVLVLGERVRAACLEKIATFCGPEAVSQEFPVLPQFQEPRWISRGSWRTTSHTWISPDPRRRTKVL